MKIKKTVVVQYYLIVIIFTLVDFLFGSGYASFVSSKGLSGGEIGQIFMFWSIFSLIFGLPFGGLGDRYGRKNMISLGFLFWGIGLGIFYFAYNYSFFILAFLLLAIGQALIGQLPIAWFVSTIEGTSLESEQEKVLPIAESLSKGVSFLAGCIFSIVVVNFNGGSPYLIASIFAVIFGLVVFFKYKEGIQRQNSKSSNKYTFFIIQSFKNIKNSKVLLLFYLKTLIGNIAGQLFVFCWQLYLIQELGVKDHVLGPMYSFFILFLSLGYLLSAKMGNKMDKKIVSIIGSSAMLVSFIVIFITKEVSVFVVAALLFEVGLGVDQGAALVWIQPEIWESSRATTLSFIPLIGAISRIIASAIMTPFLNVQNFIAIWSVSILMTLISIFILIQIRRISVISKQ